MDTDSTTRPRKNKAFLLILSSVFSQSIRKYRRDYTPERISVRIELFFGFQRKMRGKQCVLCTSGVQITMVNMIKC